MGKNAFTKSAQGLPINLRTGWYVQMAERLIFSSTSEQLDLYSFEETKCWIIEMFSSVCLYIR